MNGLVVSTDSELCCGAFNQALWMHLKFMCGAEDELSNAITHDPDFALAYVFRGYIQMQSYNFNRAKDAAVSLCEARSRSGRMNVREAAHANALSLWIHGNLHLALQQWEHILDDYPLDIMALWLHHFNTLWLGRPESMHFSVERVVPFWSSEQKSWTTFLACRSFANEEVGNYLVAENLGRMSVESDPSEMWGAHAVAHVFEMQGRRLEGLSFIDALEPNWGRGNNFKHHIFWHSAMFNMELFEFDEVLDLYDRKFRNVNSPLTQSIPDLHVDIQNSVSTLFRLELQSVDVGQRWGELADKAESRIGDCLSAFTLPHWVMALSTVGRDSAVVKLLDALRECASGVSPMSRTLKDVALPVCSAIVAYRKKDYLSALTIMRPVVGIMYRLGGSPLQQDLLEQLYMDSAVRVGSSADVELVLERVSGRHPVPVSKRIGYSAVAEKYGHI
ncbi:TPA: tetratricopeptide repeat protein [Pseudomonas aeruginosa]